MIPKFYSNLKGNQLFAVGEVEDVKGDQLTQLRQTRTRKQLPLPAFCLIKEVCHPVRAPWHDPLVHCSDGSETAQWLWHSIVPSAALDCWARLSTSVCAFSCEAERGCFA